jgi:hypothetical protein
MLILYFNMLPQVQVPCISCALHLFHEPGQFISTITLCAVRMYIVQLYLNYHMIRKSLCSVRIIDVPSK